MVPSWIYKQNSAKSSWSSWIKTALRKTLPQLSTKSTNHMQLNYLGNSCHNSVPFHYLVNKIVKVEWGRVAQVWSCVISSEHDKIDEPSATPLVWNCCKVLRQGWPLAPFQIATKVPFSRSSVQTTHLPSPSESGKMSSLGDVVIDEARIQSMKRAFTFGGFWKITSQPFREP